MLEWGNNLVSFVLEDFAKPQPYTRFTDDVRRSAPKVLDVRELSTENISNLCVLHDYLRFAVAVSKRIIALAWHVLVLLAKSLGICPIN